MFCQTAAMFVPFATLFAPQLSARPLAITLGKVCSFARTPGTSLRGSVCMIPWREAFGNGRFFSSLLRRKSIVYCIVSYGLLSSTTGPSKILGMPLAEMVRRCMQCIRRGNVLQIIEDSSYCSRIVHTGSVDTLPSRHPVSGIDAPERDGVRMVSGGSMTSGNAQDRRCGGLAVLALRSSHLWIL